MAAGAPPQLPDGSYLRIPPPHSSLTSLQKLMGPVTATPGSNPYMASVALRIDIRLCAPDALPRSPHPEPSGKAQT